MTRSRQRPLPHAGEGGRRPGEGCSSLCNRSIAAMIGVGGRRRVPAHVFVSNANDRDAEFRQITRASHVVVLLRNGLVTAAIDLDGQLQLYAVEIGEVVENRALPANFTPRRRRSRNQRHTIRSSFVAVRRRPRARSESLTDSRVPRHHVYSTLRGIALIRPSATFSRCRGRRR